MIRHIFFDRDGTLGELGDIKRPQSLVYFADAAKTLAELKKRGYRLFIASNQSCIARGTDGGYSFAEEFVKYGFDDWFICPHDGSDGCRCRKPKTGLLDSAVAKYALDRKECLMVGDRESDIACAKNAGMYAALLQKNKDPIRCTPEPDLMIGSLSELLLHFPRLPSEN